MDINHEIDLIRIRGQLPLVFTPAAPVERGELFAGRTTQIQRVLDAVASPGQHVVIFGERGVGKTSLASLIQYFWERVVKDRDLLAIWITCNSSDTFGTIWAKVLDAIERGFSTRSIELPDPDSPLAATMEQINAGVATPDDVSRLFALAGKQFVITIDEFDRVEDTETRILTADTIKAVADHRLLTTLVIVGVADTVTDLIEDHRSVGRNLAQVLMPRMSVPELTDVIQRGADQLGLQVEPNAGHAIAKLSQGLPHYTHLLSLYAGINAVDDQRIKMTTHDLPAALDAAVSNAYHSVSAAYHAATASNRPKTIFKEVLLACALASSDDLGYFAPRDVVEPLCHITNKEYRIPAFISHLHAFCEESRESVLHASGSERRQRYRFTDPVLKPYVVLRGLKEQMVDTKYVLKSDSP